MRLFAGILVGLLLVMTLLFLAAESADWMQADALAAWITSPRESSSAVLAAAAIVIALLMSDLVLPIPSSIVMTLSGAALGWFWGAVASVAGAMGSALLGFALCRRYGRPAFARLVHADELTRVQRFLSRFGPWGIVLSRSIPMLTEIVSCAAGLGDMPLRQFAALSAAGTIPICLVYAWAGSCHAQSGFGWAVLLAFALPAAGLVVARRLAPHRKAPPQP